MSQPSGQPVPTAQQQPTVPRARPSRGARWAIGLVLAGTCLLTGLVGGAVAIAQAAGGDEPCVSEWATVGMFCGDDDLTGRALARVGHVTEFDFFAPEPESGSSRLPTHVLVVDFEVDGVSYEATVEWYGTAGPPEVDEYVEIAYDPQDPGWVVASAEALDAKLAREAAAGRRVSPAAVWTFWLGIGGAGVLLGETVVWARRAPRPVRPARQPVGWYGMPYGYPQPAYGPPPTAPQPAAAPVVPTPQPPPQPPSTGWSAPG